MEIFADLMCSKFVSNIQLSVKRKKFEITLKHNIFLICC